MIDWIDLRESDRAKVAAILRECLPQEAAVWVYGSRAKGRARRGSDLDLAVDAGRPLSWEERAGLSSAFEDSDLPWTVDVVDWRTIKPAFRARIKADRLPFPFAETGA